MKPSEPLVTSQVRCNGKMHRVSLLTSGAIHFHDHTREERRVLVTAMALGLPRPRCFTVVDAWTRVLGKPQPKPSPLSEQWLTSSLPEGMEPFARDALDTQRSRFEANQRGWFMTWGPTWMSLRALQATFNPTLQLAKRRAYGQRQIVRRIWRRLFPRDTFVWVTPTANRNTPMISADGRSNGTVLRLRLPANWWQAVYLAGLAEAGGTFVAGIDATAPSGGARIVVAVYSDPDTSRLRLRRALIEAPGSFRWLRGKAEATAIVNRWNGTP